MDVFFLSQDIQVYPDQHPSDPGVTQQGQAPSGPPPPSLQRLTGTIRCLKFHTYDGISRNNVSCPVLFFSCTDYVIMLNNLKERRALIRFMLMIEYLVRANNRGLCDCTKEDGGRVNSAHD